MKKGIICIFFVLIVIFELRGLGGSLFSPVLGSFIVEDDPILKKTIKGMIDKFVLRKGVKIKLLTVKVIPKELPKSTKFLQEINERVGSQFLFGIFREGDEFYILFCSGSKRSYIVERVKGSFKEFEKEGGKIISKMITSFLTERSITIKYELQKKGGDSSPEKEMKKSQSKQFFGASLSYEGLFVDLDRSLTHGIRIEGNYSPFNKLSFYLGFVWFSGVTAKTDSIKIELSYTNLSIGIAYKKEIKSKLLLSIYGGILLIYNSRRSIPLKEQVIVSKEGSYWTGGTDLGLRIGYQISEKGEIFVGGGFQFLFGKKKHIFIREGGEEETIFEPSQYQPFFCVGLNFIL